MDRKSAGSLPFVGAMNDSVDFMRKLWGATGLPGLPTASGISQFAQGLPQALPSMITPTLDVDELDKRIADLRAVEQWLALNANMLRATIQSLEVQRNTIATLKSFGGSMLSSMRVGGGSQEPAPVASTNPYLKPRPAPTPVHAPAPAAAAPRPTPPRARARKKTTAGPAPAMPLNPALWWGALHDQFTKVATAAATAANESAAAGKAADKARSGAKDAANGKAGNGLSATGRTGAHSAGTTSGKAGDKASDRGTHEPAGAARRSARARKPAAP